MSRHRNLRGEDWDDYRDDDYYDDDYYDEEDDDYYDDDEYYDDEEYYPEERIEVKKPQPKQQPKQQQQKAQQKQQPKQQQQKAQPKTQQKTQQKAQQKTTKTKEAATAEDKLSSDLGGLNLDSSIPKPVTPKTPSTSPAPSKEAKQRTPARHKELLGLAEKQAKESQTEGKKSAISVVVIGHVDSGKSTTMGHLLYLTGSVSKRVMGKLERDSKSSGKGSFAYAWVMDENEEERTRGVTVDVGVTSLETPHHHVTVLDAPGHRDFVPNMISGTTQADAAVLIVNAAPGGFEAGFERGGQTREHMNLAGSFGIKQLIVAVNQMDRAEWKKARYDEIVAKVGAFAAKSPNLAGTSLTYLPISGFVGTNLLKNDEPRLAAWYAGPSLLQAIDALQPPKRALEAPLRMCLGDTFRSQLGLHVSGRIEAGIVAQGDRLLVAPAGELCTVKAVYLGGERADFAVAGDNAVLCVGDIDERMLGAGSVLCDPERPIQIARHIAATVQTAGLDYPILPGSEAVLFAHSASTPVVFSKLVEVINGASGAVVKKKPRCVGENQTVNVELTLKYPICLELNSEVKQFGRISLRSLNRVIASGIVTAITQKK